MTALARHIGAGNGAVHRLAADRFTIKLEGTEEHAPFCLFEYEAAPGVPGPPRHVHHTFEEAWFILDGDVTFSLDERVAVGRRGDFLWVPRGAVHTFAVAGDVPARWVGILSPGRYVAMLDDLGALLAATPMPSLDDMVTVFRRHDSDIVPPPPAPS